MRAMRTSLIGGSMLATGAVLAWFVFLQGDPPTARAQEAGAVFVDAQSLAGLSVGEMTQQLKPVMDYGKQAVKDGNYATAVTCFDQISAVLPDSYPRMDALLWSGIARSRGGDPPGARVIYEQMIDMGKGLLVEDHTSTERHVPMEVGCVESIRDLIRRGLIYQIWIYRDAGQAEEALWTIRRLRAEEPEYYYLRKVLPIEAELLGLDAKALDDQELQASRLSDQAKRAWRDGDAAKAYQLADQAISTYPETGGALLARNLKARMLWRHKRYDEARAVYAENLRRLEPVGPTSDLALEAQSKIAWLDATALLKSLIRARIEDRSVEDVDRERLQVACREVMSYEKDPKTRAQAHIMLIHALYWQGDMTGTLKESSDFISQNNTEDRTSEFLHEIAVAHIFAGDALREIGEQKEALAHYQWSVQSHRLSPQFSGDVLARQRGLSSRILDGLYDKFSSNRNTGGQGHGCWTNGSAGG